MPDDAVDEDDDDGDEDVCWMDDVSCVDHVTFSGALQQRERESAAIEGSSGAPPSQEFPLRCRLDFMLPRRLMTAGFLIAPSPADG